MMDRCLWCQQAKEFFKEKGVDFKEINITSDKKAQEKVIYLSGQTSMPVIDIDGNIIVGFDIEQINKYMLHEPKEKETNEEIDSKDDYFTGDKSLEEE